MRFLAGMSFLFLSWQIYAAVEQCTDEDLGSKIQSGNHEAKCGGASYVSGLSANNPLGSALKEAKCCKAAVALPGDCVEEDFTVIR